MLLTIVPSCLHEGNQKRHQTRVTSRRWDKAARWIQDRVSPQSLKTYLVLQRLSSGQPRHISKRLLASRRGVSTKTIYNHTCELIEAKVMRAVYVKISRCRNAPNLYIFLDIDGQDLHLSVAKNCMEEPLQPLNPLTTPRVARVENHPPAMRKLYEHNANLLGRLRLREQREAYRLRAAQDRTRRAMQVNVGVYAGPVIEWEEDKLHEVRQRIAENERKSRESRGQGCASGVGVQRNGITCQRR